MDYHWIPASELCNQCLYFFTYLVKLESLSEDYNWLAKRINLTEDRLGHNGQVIGNSIVNDHEVETIQKFMKKLPHGVITLLYTLYSRDFETYGYTFNMDTYIAGGFT